MTKYERDALRDVNKIRAAEGRKALKRLPPGERGEEFSCPIARALNRGKVGVGELLKVPPKKVGAYLNAGLGIQVCGYDSEYDHVHLTPPPSFERFVAWFDEEDA